MLSHITKYRQPLLSLLVVAYLANAFQHPVYEALHLFSHALDSAMIDFKYHNHQYYHENGIDHEHAVLSLLNTSPKDENAPYTPTSDDTKKKVEWLNPILPSSPSVDHEKHEFFALFRLTSIYQELIAPPPEHC